MIRLILLTAAAVPVAIALGSQSRHAVEPAGTLAEAALEFGSFEFFWLALFGIILSGQLTQAGAPVTALRTGWLMLTRSYFTLGEKDKATAAIRDARGALADTIRHARHAPIMALLFALSAVTTRSPASPACAPNWPRPPRGASMR